MAASAPRDISADRGEAGDLAPYDLAVFDDAGDSLPIWPCRGCDVWHVQIVRGAGDDLVAREWHAPDCPHLLAISMEE